jgi:hypothetical protein
MDRIGLGGRLTKSLMVPHVAFGKDGEVAQLMKSLATLRGVGPQVAFGKDGGVAQFTKRVHVLCTQLMLPKVLLAQSSVAAQLVDSMRALGVAAHVRFGFEVAEPQPRPAARQAGVNGW